MSTVAIKQYLYIVIICTAPYTLNVQSCKVINLEELEEKLHSILCCLKRYQHRKYLYLFLITPKETAIICMFSVLVPANRKY